MTKVLKNFSVALLVKIASDARKNCGWGLACAEPITNIPGSSTPVFGFFVGYVGRVIVGDLVVFYGNGVTKVLRDGK